MNGVDVYRSWNFRRATFGRWFDVGVFAQYPNYFRNVGRGYAGGVEAFFHAGRKLSWLPFRHLTVAVGAKGSLFTEWRKPRAWVRQTWGYLTPGPHGDLYFAWGRFGFVTDAPRWLVRLKIARDEREMERQLASMPDDFFPPDGYGPDDGPEHDGYEETEVRYR